VLEEVVCFVWGKRVMIDGLGIFEVVFVWEKGMVVMMLCCGGRRELQSERESGVARYKS
jgi:putative component of toxin-antitoxin plasmid stabilization module